MKSYLLLIIISGLSATFAFFIIFLVDSNFQVDTDYCLQCSLKKLYTQIPCNSYSYRCQIRIEWFVLLISLACGVITFFLYKFYKKMKWDNDFIYLFIRTRLKRGSQKMKSAKNKMRRELDDE